MNSVLKNALKPFFKVVADMPLGNPHHGQEIELMVKKEKPTCMVCMDWQINHLKEHPNPKKEKALNQMKEMIDKGDIVFIGEKRAKYYDRMIQTYAQADQIEEGKELFARFYKDGEESYPELNPVEHDIRIGELLGYQECDLKLCKTTGVAGFLLDTTMKWRRSIRKELQKEHNI